MARTEKTRARILLLEDDPAIQLLLTEYYTPWGFQLDCYSDPIVPLREFEAASDPSSLYDLVLTDFRMPKLDGIEFITRMKRLAPDVPIILMTAHSNVETAVKAIESGAYDYVVKPFHFPQLNVSIERALHFRSLQRENRELRSVVKNRWSFEGVVGRSAAITGVLELARRVSNSTATVLISGETGTGKEVIARAIHQHGNRKDSPFVAINCSAIPENLLESELFGHAKGAFTGAIDKKIGLFEEADTGTLFLDEIGDLDLALQAKLLRVLQERKVKRIGENQFRAVDVRIIAATHKNLAEEVAEGRFLEDLFFRLNVIPIRIPPLRERLEDVLLLAEHFLRQFKMQNNVEVHGFTHAAIQHLLSLPWRGNVRELENTIERAVVLCTGNQIDVEDLTALSGGRLTLPVIQPQAEDVLPDAAPVPVSSSPTSSASGSLDIATLIREPMMGAPLPTLEAFNLEYIDYVMRTVGGVKEHAARILNVDRKTLYRKIKELESKRGKGNESSEHSDSESAGAGELLN